MMGSTTDSAFAAGGAKVTGVGAGVGETGVVIGDKATGAAAATTGAFGAGVVSAIAKGCCAGGGVTALFLAGSGGAGVGAGEGVGGGGGGGGAGTMGFGGSMIWLIISTGTTSSYARTSSPLCSAAKPPTCSNTTALAITTGLR